MIDNFDEMSQMTYDRKREYEENAKMSKELKALEKIKFYAGDTWINSIEWNTIEDALKRLEELERKHNELLYNYAELVHCGMKSEQKKLKAFEIIKEKKVDTLLLFRCFELDNLYGHSHFELYNQELYTQNITEEEYKLLKEVLL